MTLVLGDSALFRFNLLKKVLQVELLWDCLFLADLEERNVFENMLVFKINEDFSRGVSNEWNLDLSVNLDLVSLRVNHGCAGQILVGLEL